MSFEGYYQILCRNGHLHECNCYLNPNFEDYRGSGDPLDYDPSYYSPLWKCPDCGELAAWWNLVDETNGAYCECNIDLLERSEGCEHCDRGRIDGMVDLEIDKPVKTCVCKECGNFHVVSPETYRVPKQGGHLVNSKGVLTK